ncbi:MAG: stage V sporulation protein AE [Clostridiales bacterium]|nr:stage V sporulation protein AE [Clostridiales bacterium]
MDYLMFLKAFVVGGLICVIGQLFIDYTTLTPAKILVGFVTIGVVLGAIGIYDPLVKWAGAGATVPLSGFGYALAIGTKKAIQKDGLLGVLTGPLSAGSAGITAALISGLIASLISKPHAK